MAATKAAQTYAAITRLMEAGTRLSDAVRQTAAETGRSETAVRASYYQQRSKLGGHGRREPVRPPGPVSVDDAIRQARQLLERALERIDEDLSAAKADRDAAAERYETLKASAAEQKAELERKIAALSQ